MAAKKIKKAKIKNIDKNDLPSRPPAPLEPQMAGLPRSALAWTLGFLLLGQPLILDLFSTDEYETPKLIFLRVAVALMMVGWSWDLGRLGLGKLRLRQTLPMISLLIVLSLSTLFSTSPWVSFFGEYGSYAGLQSMTLYLLVTLGAMSLASARDLRWVLIMAQLGLAASTIMGLTEASGHEIGTFWGLSADIPDHSTSGFFGNPNYFAGFTIANLPISLWLIRDRNRVVRVVALLTALGSGVALVLSGSRAGILFLMIGAVSLLALMALRWQKKREPQTSEDLAKTKKVVVVTGLAVLLVFVVGAIVAGPQLHRVGRSLISPFHAVAQDRLDLWQSALGLASAHPILGSGPDTFAAAAAAHYPVSVYQRLGANVTARRAHNELLNTLACTGLVGLAAWLWFFGGSIWAGFRQARKKIDQDSGLLLLAVTTGLTFGIGFNLLHFFTIGQAPWLYASVGIIWAWSRFYHQDQLALNSEPAKIDKALWHLRPKISWALVAAASLLVVFATVDGAYWIQAERALKKSYIANLRHQPAAAVKTLEQAVRLRPDQRRYHEALAQTLLRVAKSDSDIKKARQSIHRALALGASPLSMWVDLAIERRAGDVEKVEKIARQVVAADPTRPRELESISQWLIGLGRYETVVSLLDTTFAAAPQRALPLAVKLASSFARKTQEPLPAQLSQRFSNLAQALSRQILQHSHDNAERGIAQKILSQP